jgi:hypothetical protein
MRVTGDLAIVVGRLSAAARSGVITGDFTVASSTPAVGRFGQTGPVRRRRG